MKKAISFLLVLMILISVFASLSFSTLAATLYWPVPGHTRLSQGYHGGNAIDINDSTIGGAPVIAAMGGTVTTIYQCPTQHYGSYGDCKGFGTGLVIRGDDGRTYQYAHMQGGSIPADVYYGAYVSAGKMIGRVGTTGYSSGNHLHFGISYTANYWDAGPDPSTLSYIYTSGPCHQYGAWIVTARATCTSAGSQYRVCSICGGTETQSIAASGHNYKATNSEPTCTHDGYTEHHCQNCGDIYYTNIIPKFGHNYLSATNEATCTEGGYTINYCETCKETHIEYIDALEHDFEDNYTVDISATIISDGTKSRHCSRCEEKTDVSTFKYGDMNSDDKIDALDLADFRKYISSFSINKNFVACDMNNDGEVDIRDFIRLKRILAGAEINN